jgi:flagellin
MRINHNISALKANNQLVKTNNSLDKSLEKLSSGYRINHAADDSAGMAISEKMRTQIKGLDQASRNASDGISVIQTAEGALVEVEAMLQRMRELSVQAANGTYTADDRASVQSEMDQLNKEIERISANTEFNTMSLLDGNVDRKSYSNNDNVELIALSDTVSVGDYGIHITQDARQAVLLGDGSVFPAAGAPSGTININGESVVIDSGDSIETVYSKIRNTCDLMNINIFAFDGDDLYNAVTNTTGQPSLSLYPESAGYESKPFEDGDSLAFVSKEYGSDQKINIFCNNPDLCVALGLSVSGVEAEGVDAVAELTYNSEDDTSLFKNTATLSIKGNQVSVTDSNDFSMLFEVKPGTAGTRYLDERVTADNSTTDPSDLLIDGAGSDIVVSVLDAGPMDLQIGANEGQIMSVRIPRVNPKTLGIDKVNIGTQDGAERAITLLDAAVNQVSAIRSKLGAYQNRLEHSISNLDVGSENMTESLSRIEDVDMAEEMANYTQKNVLSQAGTAMLSQANQRPQSILSLLQS